MKVQKSPNLAEVAISYKSKVKFSDRLKLQSANDAYNILKDVYTEGSVDHHEEFVILLVNRANHVLGWAKISIGGVGAALVDTKIIFQYALKANASGIILSHNHPSGQRFPSDQDKILTAKIVKAGQYLEIQILDHIIFTSEGYYSFAEEGDI